VNPALYVLAGSLIGGLITNGPRWLSMREERRKIKARVDHTDAETDSIAVRTANEVVAMVDSQMSKLRSDIEVATKERHELAVAHRKCQIESHDLNSLLEASKTREAERDVEIGNLRRQVADMQERLGP